MFPGVPPGVLLSLACLPGVPPEQERNVALSGKQILLAGLIYYSCEASLACPLSVARLAWRACLACSLSLSCLLGVLSEPGVLAWHLNWQANPVCRGIPCPGVPPAEASQVICLVGPY